ncbi:DNA replication protein DnaC [Nonomuraea rubra]|uniref:DNA replication protein DnaC n=1 Tax=Nonomuraea rubra TaxID=46180 RepID=A0A7X0TX19_9ACTN|nr:DNA replication protein DnaC [Nonomuraea rubra]
MVFIGRPSVGKTMIAIGLAGHRTHFTTCDDLIRRLKRVLAEHRLGLS